MTKSNEHLFFKTEIMFRTGYGGDWELAQTKPRPRTMQHSDRLARLYTDQEEGPNQPSGRRLHTTGIPGFLL